MAGVVGDVRSREAPAPTSLWHSDRIRMSGSPPIKGDASATNDASPTPTSARAARSTPYEGARPQPSAATPQAAMPTPMSRNALVCLQASENTGDATIRPIRKAVARSPSAALLRSNSPCGARAQARRRGVGLGGDGGITGRGSLASSAHLDAGAHGAFRRARGTVDTIARNHSCGRGVRGRPGSRPHQLAVAASCAASLVRTPVHVHQEVRDAED